jgi:hypothetical protein
MKSYIDSRDNPERLETPKHIQIQVSTVARNPVISLFACEFKSPDVSEEAYQRTSALLRDGPSLPPCAPADLSPCIDLEVIFLDNP